MWSPHTGRDISGLESVQCHAARWACGSQWDSISRKWSKSSDDCLNSLRWPSLTDCCNYLSVSTLYDILNNRKHLLTFMITIAVILPAPEPMNCLLYLYYLLSTVTIILFLWILHFCGKLYHLIVGLIDSISNL